MIPETSHYLRSVHAPAPPDTAPPFRSSWPEKYVGGVGALDVLHQFGLGASAGRMLLPDDEGEARRARDAD